MATKRQRVDRLKQSLPLSWQLCVSLILGTLLTLSHAITPTAQTTSSSDKTAIFDLSRKPEKPDISSLRAIRFLTDDDYPPFHFPGADGQLTGFNVDLARAVCQELKVACTIQARRWDTLISSLEEGRGDAIIASMSGTETTRSKVDFGIPYYRTPGRFVMRKDGKIITATVDSLAGKSIAVVVGSAHAAFISTYFTTATQKVAPDQEEALKFLTTGQVDVFFGDGISLALWLNSSNGTNCCAFLGGAFLESHFFGEGPAIAFRKDASQLRKAVDFALFRLAETGVYQNLMLKYFPVSFY
jgi:polar amino acid transport system substrate-binding protein